MDNSSRIKQAYDLIKIPEGRLSLAELTEKTPRTSGTEKKIRVSRSRGVIAAAAAVTLLAGGAFAAVKQSSRPVADDISSTVQTVSPLASDSVENAVKNASAAAGRKYQNIVLPESINIPEADTAYIISVDNEVPVDKVESRYNELTKAVLGETYPSYARDEGYVSKYYFHASIPAGEDGAANKGSTVDEQSFFIFDEMPFRKPDGSFTGVYDKCAAVYTLGKDSLEGVSYKVSGEDCPIADAVALAEGFCRDKLGNLCGHVSRLYPYKVFVFECPNAGGSYYYYISFRKEIDGIPLSTSGCVATDGIYMRRSTLSLCIGEPGKISEIQGQYENISGLQKLEKIITLEAALEHAEAVLAPEQEYTVKEVSLEYCAKVGQEKDGSDPEGIDLRASCKAEYHPMWCLKLREYGDRRWSVLDPDRILAIDAVNGEVMLWDNTADGTGGMVFTGGNTVKGAETKAEPTLPRNIADNGFIRMDASWVQYDGHILVVRYKNNKLYEPTGDQLTENYINSFLNSPFTVSCDGEALAELIPVNNGDERTALLEGITGSIEADISVQEDIRDGSDSDALSKARKMTDGLGHSIRIEKNYEAAGFVSETGSRLTVSDLGIWGDSEACELIDPRETESASGRPAEVFVTNENGKRYNISDDIRNNFFCSETDEERSGFVSPIMLPVPYPTENITEITIGDRIYTRES